MKPIAPPQPDLILSTAALTACAITILLIITLIHRKKNRAETQFPKVPGAFPFIGNYIGNLDNLVANFEQWASIYGKDGIFEMNIFGRKIFVVCDDKIATKIESLRPYKVQRLPALMRVVTSLKSEGLFAAEGDVWRKDRRLIGPSLSRKNVRGYIDAVKLVNKRLMNKLRSLSGGGAVAINNLILSSTLDIIALVTCDIDMNSLSSCCQMGNDLKVLLASILTRAYSPIPYWKIPIIGQHLDGGGGAANRLAQTYQGLIRKNENLTDTGKPKNFLTSILSLNKANNSEDAMSEQRMIGNIMTMFAAGSETTHVTLCSSLWEVANDKSGLQNELAAEALAMNDFENAGLDEITNCLPRLRSLIYEVLRIRGPSPYMGAQNMEEIEIAGKKMPPHTSFFLAWRYISTLDSADPERLTPMGPQNTPRNQFCPRRWLTTSGDGSISIHNPTHKHGWRPFGVGMRVCPGRDFAEVEMLIILASILRNFGISLEKNHAPMKLVSRFTECPDIDIRLCLTPRTHR